MPTARISMRKIREILRLKWDCGLSQRQIAESCAVARPTITEYLQRAEAAGVAWPLPAELDDEALERLLFPVQGSPRAEARPIPQWTEVHQELKRKGVTLFLLWQEYKAAHPAGYGYTWFCTRYRTWAQKLDVVMRQEHRAGEKLFVDYAGQTVPVADPLTGQLRQAQIFVAVLGASSYTYVEATWTQSLPDWIGSHVRAFQFLGGVPEILIPDNLRSGVTQAHRYEPDLNPTYHAMATHYGVAVIPARARKPRDKAKVENAVLVVERWLLARLRQQTFFSLAGLNTVLHTLVSDLNQRPFQKLPGSRHTLFERLERPALRPLPVAPYEYAEWKKARVNIDYHLEVEGHYYSVPYQLVRQQLDVRLTAHCVECFYKGKRVSSHRRAFRKGQHTTILAHMPPAHQHYAEWTPERLVRWAEKTGPATAQVIATILASRAHPLQGFRSCLGIMRLGKTYGEARLEAACQRALVLQAYAYKSVASILRHGLDQQPLTPERVSPPMIPHANIRGPDYYH
jgi:transposase